MPERLIGVDADPHSLNQSREEAVYQGIAVELIGSDCATLAVPDASVDCRFVTRRSTTGGNRKRHWPSSTACSSRAAT